MDASLEIGPMREWKNPLKAPGGEVVRLLGVRVRSATGEIADVVDIRDPVTIEMEYEVITPGYKLMPHFLFTNPEGIDAFSAHDVDPVWRGRSRPVGKYRSTVRIPGNLLTESTLFVAAGMQTIDPAVRQFFEPYTVSFQVIEPHDADGARGDYSGHITGIMRPLLEWNTECYTD
jgi:homopolymeric O-antigen transport system ATP-binding protein